MVLEILNRDGQVVDRVNANEVFTVRARMLVTSGADPVAAYIDLQFAVDMVSPLNNPVDLGRINSKRTVDEIKGLGRVMYYSDQPDVIFTKTFQARQVGEVTFTTNPGDHWWDEILYVGLKAPLPTSLVKFGSITLQIDAAVPPMRFTIGNRPDQQWKSPPMNQSSSRSQFRQLIGLDATFFHSDRVSSTRRSEDISDICRRTSPSRPYHGFATCDSWSLPLRFDLV